MAETLTAPNRKRKWYHCSLPSFLFFAAGVCLAIPGFAAFSTWYSSFRARVQYDNAAAPILALGGYVHGDRSLGVEGIEDVFLLSPSDGNLKALGTHLETLPNLEWLQLGGAQLSDRGLEHLKGLTNLRCLVLTDTRIGDAGLEYLEGMTRITRLDLGGTQVSDAGLKHLEGMTEITNLGLWGTRVSDAGLEHLKGMTKLERLDLESTLVAGPGFEHLQGAPSLEQLWLYRTRITDTGLEHLHGMTRLRILGLPGSQVSDAGVERLQRDLANCFIDCPRTTEEANQQLGKAMAMKLAEVHPIDISGGSSLGLMGSLNVLFGLLLVIFGVVSLFVVRSRKIFVVYSATAIIPILIGGLGSWRSYRAVNAILEGAPPSALTEECVEQEWAAARPYIRDPAYAGLGCAAPILILAGIGILMRAPDGNGPIDSRRRGTDQSG